VVARPPSRFRTLAAGVLRRACGLAGAALLLYGALIVMGQIVF